LNNKAVFVLYQKETFDKKTYSEFIECNFDTFLNIEALTKEENMEEEIIYDDDSVNRYQHSLPRISGGGRKLNANYSYECIWCPKEVIKLGKKGRFRELRSYRDHFRVFHHGEKGTGVPMADFVEKVQRVEPTWFCRVCKLHCSLGNAVRHKSICKLEQYSTDSESDCEETNVIGGQKKSLASKKKKEISIYDDTSSDEKETEMTQEQTVTEENMESEKTRECMNTTEKQNKDPKRTILDESLSYSDEPSERSKRKTKKKVKTVTTDYTFLDVEDEIYCSASEDDVPDKILEPKVELIDETEFEIEINVNPKTQKTPDTTNRWWLKIPKHLYGDKGLGGPNIFLPEDSEEFVRRCTDRYKKHMQDKLMLDQQMKEAESQDAQLLQFSTERDKPILEKYTAFVQTASAKDVLHIFSEEYEQLELPTGAKSSTAGQYSYRILEFFKFMARSYQNFHLDWMVDFKGKIEKTYQDGTKSNDIFLPTKEDFTEFIKQFKYGGKSVNFILCLI
jgi:hypothetical protein